MTPDETQQQLCRAAVARIKRRGEHYRSGRQVARRGDTMGESKTKPATSVKKPMTPATRKPKGGR